MYVSLQEGSSYSRQKKHLEHPASLKNWDPKKVISRKKLLGFHFYIFGRWMSHDDPWLKRVISHGVTRSECRLTALDRRSVFEMGFKRPGFSINLGIENMGFKVNIESFTKQH
jgi:hypothetical protein